jgi:hypothetical protein
MLNIVQAMATESAIENFERMDTYRRRYCGAN